MKYKNTLLAVADMERSKRFYREVLGLRVVADFGANVTLSGGLALQTLESWRDFIGKEEICFFNNAAEVYFEEDDFDAFAERLAAFGVNYVHPVLEHRWGQCAFTIPTDISWKWARTWLRYADVSPRRGFPCGRSLCAWTFPKVT